MTLRKILLPIVAIIGLFIALIIFIKEAKGKFFKLFRTEFLHTYFKALKVFLIDLDIENYTLDDDGNIISLNKDKEFNDRLLKLEALCDKSWLEQKLDYLIIKTRWTLE